jgi:hypothetical protein
MGGRASTKHGPRPCWGETYLQYSPVHGLGWLAVIELAVGGREVLSLPLDKVFDFIFMPSN